MVKSILVDYNLFGVCNAGAGVKHDIIAINSVYHVGVMYIHHLFAAAFTVSLSIESH